MSTHHSVNVSGIAPLTTQSHLHDFFTFCGKINSIDYNEATTPKSAVIHFEKPSAAKTALMLNGGTLDGAHLTVTSEKEHEDEEREEGTPIDQTDKPRAGIAAEYLAKGYVLSDGILQRAIDIDNKQGISKRFLSYITSLDSTIGAKTLGPDQTISGKMQSTLSSADSGLGTRALGPNQTISGKLQSTFNAAHTRARSVDEQKGITRAATDYYSKALSSTIGQKVHAFYTSTSKQVLDIHEEAARIAATQKANAAGTAADPVSTSATAIPSAAGSEKIPEPTTQAAPLV